MKQLIVALCIVMVLILFYLCYLGIQINSKLNIVKNDTASIKNSLTDIETTTRQIRSQFSPFPNMNSY